MTVADWPALGRSVLRFLCDRLLRGLLALGTMATGVAAPGWWKTRGEHWWEGAAPVEGSGPRSLIAAARVEPGGLADPRVVRGLRALRGSQDLPPLAGTAESDAAPHWHPERRPADEV